MTRLKQSYEPKTKALPHQIEAINYINVHREVALFDEQGLGKTKIVIDSLCSEMKAGEIEGVLVVAPNTLLYNWEQEVTKHSFLIPNVLRGTKREKRYKYLTEANFYITNYEAVIAELQRIIRFCKSRKIAIVLDESSRMKNPNTETAKSLFKLQHYASKKIIITGTPVANKPLDLWAQFYFLDRGRLLGDDFKLFKSKYNENDPQYFEALSELKAIISNNSIRRCKNDTLELPEKIFLNIYVNLKDEQLELYDELRKELRIEIEDLEGHKIYDEADNILKKLLRLTQIASNPALIIKKYKGVSAKFVALENLISELTSKDEKVIIWTCFVENIFVLKNMLRQYKPLVIYGKVSVEDRANAVNSFQSSEKNRILIANPAAAREGLTLTRANNAVYLDRNFNLVDYLQSQDRIHRISQDKACRIFKLLAKNTIDEFIDKVIEMKRDIAGFVQNDYPDLSKSSIDFIHNKKELLNILG